MRPRHLLLVEDDDSIRKALSRALTSNGWEVTTASSLTELKSLGSCVGSIDAVLTDMELNPDGSTGTEVAAYMQGLQPKVSVVYMSGKDRDGLRQRGLSLGPNDILLTKPVPLAELEQTLTTAAAKTYRA
jgi:two-component system phosphate regulon response regulator OmpR